MLMSFFLDTPKQSDQVDTAEANAIGIQILNHAASIDKG